MVTEYCRTCGQGRQLKRVSATGRCVRCANAERNRQRAAELKAIPLEVRIRQKVQETADGCWLWTGHRYSNGYGALGYHGKQQLVHRLAYREFVGDIPDGLTIDHLCRNRACVNPVHLEAVTSGENTRRAMRSHCVNGHEFSEANTWMHDGKRYCRTCRRRRVREYQIRRHNGAVEK